MSDKSDHSFRTTIEATSGDRMGITIQKALEYERSKGQARELMTAACPALFGKAEELFSRLDLSDRDQALATEWCKFTSIAEGAIYQIQVQRLPQRFREAHQPYNEWYDWYAVWHRHSSQDAPRRLFMFNKEFLTDGDGLLIIDPARVRSFVDTFSVIAQKIR